MPAHGFDNHNHAHCIDEAMAAAQAHCQTNGLQFTRVRRRVLEILLSEHRALGAYDILPVLAEEDLGKQPPVVYRALEFLTSNGFVHKIERLNAYIACTHPGTDHAPAFLICRDCSRVVEAKSQLGDDLGAEAKNIGFAVEAAVMEIEGLCPKCRPTQ